MQGLDPNDIVAILNELQFGHLQRRVCTEDSPMAMADKDRYRWTHPDALELGPYLNLVKCECPHCGLAFTCLPRPVTPTTH
jgi:hypothetical protein